MDDHKIHTLVSVAGNGNGLFYGPQASDALPARGFLDVLAPIMTNTTLFDYTKYSPADIASGKMAVDWVKLHESRPELQAVGAGYNLYRSPVLNKWTAYNPFFPVIGNLRNATGSALLAKEQAWRKQNFLRLHAAHFFASPADAGISPWQSAVLGAYESVDSVEALERDFKKLRVLPMEETPEYTGDTYGLATLDKRGGVFLHVEENVGHGCWLMDEVPYNSTVECRGLYSVPRPPQCPSG
jgi:palmitoyl-protein thioesterase